MSIIRLFVNKRAPFAQESHRLANFFKTELALPIETVQIYERYDIEGLDTDDFEKAKSLIFSEPPVDEISDTLSVPTQAHVICREFIPGQYDQRADSAEQCLAMCTLKTGATVRAAQVLVITGNLTAAQLETIKTFYINPVDSREASQDLPNTLALQVTPAQEVAILHDFITLSDQELYAKRVDLGLAMSDADIKLIQTYFREEEQRDPSLTEIRVLDTYWSDHCRHTTFMTELTNITIEDSPLTVPIKAALEEYLRGRDDVFTEAQKAKKKQCLMDMATLAVRELKKAGKLDNLDESEEINACTIIVPVDVDGKQEEWLLLFKNETHNHPTEIEPFGGAATCLGGCIRDPLSGRSYVYQAMRVTGSGNPHTPLTDTLPGKLPQRQITTEAAKGYSSYGNQIGLATGEVHEYYHPGYVAKRMEIGAVIGAAPRDAVRREAPIPGDVVILLGGKTGRDGCGGATGSSKEHTLTSLETCGSEVQKGNALTERKIQRLFRRKEVTTLIKRCNDFGAGGVSVAIGELTDGLLIDLDKVPKKYEGLDGTELAISESQERMACVVAAKDVDAFLAYCDEENLEATVVADVTDSNRLVMMWQGKTIVDISREFLNTNGAPQQQAAHIQAPASSFFAKHAIKSTDIESQWHAMLSDLSVASQQGLAERFDSTIGSSTILMPFGGKEQKTPVQGMVAKLPVLHGETTTASIMTHGFDPYISAWSPFHGAQYAILTSIAKLVALGGKREGAYLTLQEYFERLNQDKTAWGKPTAALLGAYKAQKELEIGAIGGKDSMSGTFMDLTVPPTLVSFAVNTAHVDAVISPEFKEPDHRIVFVEMPRHTDETPNWDAFKSIVDHLAYYMDQKKIFAAYALGPGGLAEGLTKMALGNKIGVIISEEASEQYKAIQEITKSETTNLSKNLSDTFFAPLYGSFLIETDASTAAMLEGLIGTVNLGKTVKEPTITIPANVINAPESLVLQLQDLQKTYEKPLDTIFPLYAENGSGEAVAYIHDQHPSHAKVNTTQGVFKLNGSNPTALIPVFPGTNCEYDSARAFERAGANAEIFIIRNQTIAQLEDSIQGLRQKLQEVQILMFPGGFSAGDEPDGSGKFMATLFRNPYLAEELENLLYKRDGLALGICNGFQALIKLGLLPSGHVAPLTEKSPTLTYNTIGRHLSGMVHTKVISTKSPWMSLAKAGEIYTVPISHGEGRFIASPAQVVEFNRMGQIATQYVDPTGIATYDARYNPNQSVSAIEGLFSPDGRVFGKMAHIERVGYGVAKNIPGEKVMPVFASGVAYFK